MSGAAASGMRVDRLLVYLRFARTRSEACAMVDAGALRRNRKHVCKTSEQVCIGDVLTLALASEIRVVELSALPARRASPAIAETYYNDLARDGTPKD